MIFPSSGFLDAAPTNAHNDMSTRHVKRDAESQSGHKNHQHSAARALQAFVEMKNNKGLDYGLTPVEKAGELFIHIKQFNQRNPETPL